MATMKENKGKGLANEEAIQEEVHSQPRPSSAEIQKTLSRTVDLESLPSHRGHKKARHGSSKSGIVKPCSVIPSAPVK